MKHPNQNFRIFSIGFLLLGGLLPFSSHGEDQKLPKKTPPQEIKNHAEIVRMHQLLSDSYGPAWIDAQTPKGKKPAELSPDGFPVSPSGAVLTPLWIPMCFFFDPSIETARANEKIQGMVAAYASCGIALEPHSFTLKPNYPNDYQALSKAALTACPLTKVFGVRGAVQIETSYTDLPAQMCHDPKAKGCSTLCNAVSVSFLTPNAGPVIGLHESMHSNCCGPLCVDAGSGAGTPAGLDLETASQEFDLGENKITFASRGSSNQSTSITKEGCQALAAGAAKNDVTHWYDPQQTVFYTPEVNPTRLRDLMSGKNFFDPPQVAALSPAALKEIADKQNREAKDPIRRLLSGDTDKATTEIPSAIAKPKTPTLPPWSAKNTQVPVAIPAMVVPEIMGAYPPRAPMMIEVDRNRGDGLRKAGSVRRKSSGKNIGLINAYGNAGSGGNSESAEPSESSVELTD